MGTRSWLTQLLNDNVLPTIAQLEDSDAGRTKAQQLAADLRQKWVQRGAKDLQQQQGLMDQTRRMIKDRLGQDHFSLDYIRFSREESFQLNRLKQGNARERQLHQQYITDPDAIVATAVRLLDSPEWAEVAAGLAVVTGRRLNEVLKTAQFTVKSQWVVTFSGALKRRGEEVPLVFDIPTLTTAKRVVEATERLRQITPLDANESKVGQVSDRLFAHLVPAPAGRASLYSHLWRSLFCCIATFWYCPKHVDDLLFKAHIMGHFETLTQEEKGDERQLRQRLETFNSERHYRLYEIDDALIAYHQGARKGVKLGRGGVKPLEVFVEGMPQNQPATIERKHRSSLRIWKEDHDRVTEILHHFDGRTQQDKVAAWIEWSIETLSSNPAAAQSEEAIALSASSSSSKSVLGEDAEDSNALDPIQSTEPVTNSLEQPVSTGLEGKLDKLVDVIAQFIQFQMQQQANVQPSSTAPTPTQTRVEATPKSTLTPQPTQTTPVQVIETSDGSTRESKPRKYKTGEADAIVNQAINAIMKHNDQPDQPHDLKWEITINALKSFTANQRVIERIVSDRRQEIDDHHQQHHIQPGHNNRHKRKRKIGDVIQIEQ